MCITRTSPLFIGQNFFLIFCIGFSLATPAYSSDRYTTLNGSVYHDQNNNGQRDANEIGIPGVFMLATNGVDRPELDITDDDGSYSFRLEKDVIAREMAGWA